MNTKIILRCPACGLYLYYSGQLTSGHHIYTCKCCPGFTLEEDAIKEEISDEKERND